jgi:hypothetical protein
MESLRKRWKSAPSSVRKPIVLVIGSVLILAAAATGWLPGPGGIPLFLVGIAVLATEFVWAEKIRDRILVWLHAIGKQFKAHKIIGTIICIAGAALAGTVFYLLYF